MILTWVCWVMGIAGSTRALGAVSVSFPLEGHYRPGKYMPVRISASGQSGTVLLAAREAVPTQLTINASSDVIVPWLAVAPNTSDAVWEWDDDGGHAFSAMPHPLKDTERLVAFAGASGEDATSLFPHHAIVPVLLDMSRPLLEPPEAWESLDGLVLSAAAAARLNDHQVRTLLAAGTVLAVDAKRRPDMRWPWRRASGLWVLRREAAGPVGETLCLNPAAYTPTYGWIRGWQAPVRRRIVLAAALFCILAAAITLVRSRWALGAFVALCAVAAGLFAWRYSRQSVVLQMTAGIAITGGGMTQYDLWSWRSPLRGADVSFPAAGLTRPVFSDLRQISRTRVRLICGPDGKPINFRFHLGPNQTLALLTRLVRPGPVPAVSGQSQAAGTQHPPSRVLATFARDLYARPNDRIAGQIQLPNPYAEARVPTVVVTRPAPMP